MKNKWENTENASGFSLKDDILNLTRASLGNVRNAGMAG
jgi:hypothetical protein